MQNDACREASRQALKLQKTPLITPAAQAICFDRYNILLTCGFET
jgi:hypothetical protein